MRAAIISTVLVGISQAKVFQCAEPLVLSGIQTSTGSTQDTCCVPQTCATFTCPAGKQVDSTAVLTGGFTGADVNAENCCRDSTCADLASIQTYCAGFNMKYSSVQVVSTEKQSKDNCCTAWTATCDMATKFSLSGDLFACASGTVNIMSAGSLAASQDTCCMKAICSYASGNPNDQKPHTCPADKKRTPLGNSKEASDANCCEPFTPTCFEATNAGAKFTCPATQVLKTDSASMLKTPSAENCCEVFVATCAVATTTGAEFTCPAGKVLKTDTSSMVKAASAENCCEVFEAKCVLATTTGAKFTCPAGKVLKTDTSSMFKAASAENCCEVFKPTCGNSAEDGGRQGDIWQCSGKVFDLSSWNLINPSDLVCCKEPTCMLHTMDVCQDLDPKKCPTDEVLDPAKASTQYVQGYEEYCCIESSKIVFSSAERAGASVLLLLLALLQ